MDDLERFCEDATLWYVKGDGEHLYYWLYNVFIHGLDKCSSSQGCVSPQCFFFLIIT